MVAVTRKMRGAEKSEGERRGGDRLYVSRRITAKDTFHRMAFRPMFHSAPAETRVLMAPFVLKKLKARLTLEIHLSSNITTMIV
jgi:hypothetical protein